MPALEYPTKEELVEALRDAGAELRRLRDVHLPFYESKIGEPDEQITNHAEALVFNFDTALKHNTKLRTLCKVCETNPRHPSFDHCAKPGCIPF